MLHVGWLRFIGIFSTIALYHAVEKLKFIKDSYFLQVVECMSFTDID